VCVCLGLPASGSWQDLKDHMREAGDVCYADVSKDGRGVVEFLQYDDMKYAARKLDNSKFRSHEVGLLLLLIISLSYSLLLFVIVVIYAWKTGLFIFWSHNFHQVKYILTYP